MFIIKYSKFTALLLAIAFALGSISTAFAFTDNTELHSYPNNGKEAVKVGAGTVITGVATSLSAPATLTSIGSGVAAGIATVTGIAVSPAVVGGVVVAGATAAAIYAVNTFIDWVW